MRIQSRLKIIILFIILSQSVTNCCIGQTIWTDTARTYVTLGKYKLKNKVVQADYGKVIMYFSQKDYLGKKDKIDTIKTSPRYFNDNTITKLLKQGKARVIRRSNKQEVLEINHRLVQYGSMCRREFEFSDGVGFWSQLEIIGIMGAIRIKNFDSLEKDKPKPITTRIKEFDPQLEEFPDYESLNTFKIKEYLIGDPNVVYVYKEPNGSYDYKDTIACRTTSIANQGAFYFPFIGYSKFALVEIGTTLFGDGLYFYRSDSLFTIEVDTEETLTEKKHGRHNLLLPALMKIGDSVIIDYNQPKKVISYIKNENVVIGNAMHTDCVKLKILTYWDDTIYLSYVWLKKGVGMIKWRRDTGRVDVMIDRYQKNH